MGQHPTCAVCNAGRPDLQGICVECDGCFHEHCQCPVCQHGKTRLEDCVFCDRQTLPPVDAIVQADDIESDLRWLVGHEEEMS